MPQQMLQTRLITKETGETIDSASMAQMETGEAPTREVGEEAEVEAGSLNLPIKYAQRGHTAVQCFYRFDKTYPGSNHSAKEEDKFAFLTS